MDERDESSEYSLEDNSFSAVIVRISSPSSGYKACRDSHECVDSYVGWRLVTIFSEIERTYWLAGEPLILYGDILSTFRRQ